MKYMFYKTKIEKRVFKMFICVLQNEYSERTKLTFISTPPPFHITRKFATARWIVPGEVVI